MIVDSVGRNAVAILKDISAKLQAGEPLCSDGAWGTQLMARGLAPGDCFEAVIGGCCGTGPDHIRAIRAAIDRHRGQAA
jgi:methionine synthase I (cobalamin-dependent)